MADETGKSGTFEGSPTAGNSAGGAAVEPDQARAAKVGATRATVETAMADLLGGIDRPDAPEQHSLLLDEIDEQAALFSGPVAHVAKVMEAARGRGRPKGAQNKNSFRDTLLRMGYRHPGLNLAAIANADPHQLAEELTELRYDKKGNLIDVGCTPLDAMQLIIKANAELLPYFESKRPTEIHVEERQLGVMIVGEMKTERGADSAFIDLTNVEKPE